MQRTCCSLTDAPRTFRSVLADLLRPAGSQPRHCFEFVGAVSGGRRHSTVRLVHYRWPRHLRSRDHFCRSGKRISSYWGGHGIQNLCQCQRGARAARPPVTRRLTTDSVCSPKPEFPESPFRLSGTAAPAFRVLSYESVDYVVLANRLQFANVGRNDPCPSGGGKKLKNQGDPRQDCGRARQHQAAQQGGLASG